MFLCLLAHNLLYPKYHRNCRLTISRAAIKVSGQPIQIKPPKDYEVSTVTVSEHCIELVKMLKAQRAQERHLLGSKWAGDEWLFTQWNGEIMNPQTPTEQFDKFLKRHNLKHRKLHSIRHLRALSWHYFSFTNRNEMQCFDTKPCTKPCIFAHFDTFRNVLKSVCALWGGRGRGFKVQRVLRTRFTPTKVKSSKRRKCVACGIFLFAWSLLGHYVRTLSGHYRALFSKNFGQVFSPARFFV